MIPMVDHVCHRLIERRRVGLTRSVRRPWHLITRVKIVRIMRVNLTVIMLRLKIEYWE